MSGQTPVLADDETGVPRLTVAERVLAAKDEGYFPVLIRLKNGTLAAVIRGGDYHIGRAGRLDWIESKDGGKTWTEPRVVVDGPWDDRNPALGQMRNGTIVLAYWECRMYDENGKWAPSKTGSAMYYVLSKDGGKTWSQRRPLGTGPIGHTGGSPYGRIVVQRDGTALMSVYGQPDPAYTGDDRIAEAGRDAVGILRSRDNGETWGDFSLVGSGGYNETAILPIAGKTLLAASRTEPGGVLDVRRSQDGGRTWGAFQPVTGGPGRKMMQHPADLVRLKSGAVLMVYGSRVKPMGAAAVLSHDGGTTWDWEHRVMLGWTSHNTDTGYPSAVQLPDGTIVCLYYSVSTEEHPNVRQAVCVRLTEKQMAEAAAK